MIYLMWYVELQNKSLLIKSIMKMHFYFSFDREKLLV